MTYLRTGVGYARNWDNAPFQSLYGLFWQLPWQLPTVMALPGVLFSILMYYNEAQGLLQVRFSAILGLAGSNHFWRALVFLFWWFSVRQGYHCSIA